MVPNLKIRINEQHQKKFKTRKLKITVKFKTRKLKILRIKTKPVKEEPDCKTCIREVDRDDGEKNQLREQHRDHDIEETQ